MSDLDEKIRSRFRCGKCKGRSGKVRRFAATGSGVTRFLDWQRNEYISVSCSRCGYTEIYDPSALEDKKKVTEVLDLLFGLD